MVRIPIEYHNVSQELKNGDVIVTKEIKTEKPACPKCSTRLHEARNMVIDLDSDIGTSSMPMPSDVLKKLEEMDRVLDEEMVQ